MRDVQSVSQKNVKGLKVRLSLPLRALTFELLLAVLRRALVRRSRTMRTAMVPWLVPVRLTSHRGLSSERWLPPERVARGLLLPLWGDSGTVFALPRLPALDSAFRPLG